MRRLKDISIMENLFLKRSFWGEDMKLSLKNIGKVRSVTIEMNGITVIAGENDTGKAQSAELFLLCSTAFIRPI